MAAWIVEQRAPIAHDAVVLATWLDLRDGPAAPTVLTSPAGRYSFRTKREALAFCARRRADAGRDDVVSEPARLS